MSIAGEDRFDFKTDSISILLHAFGLFCLRFIVSGAQRKSLKKFPSLFGVLSKKFCRPGKETKFTENLWYGCWHIFSFSVCLYNYWDTKVMAAVLNDDFTYQWVNYDGPMDYFSKHWNMLQISFWLSCVLFSSLETWRSDSGQMMIHHAVTISLILLGHFSGMWALGCITMIIHDFSDIFLYWAKTFSYTFTPAIVTDATFAFFALSFFLTRNVVFPYVIMRPVFYGFFCDKSVLNATHPVFDGARLPILAGLFLLLALESMHVFWAWLIVKLARKLFKSVGTEHKQPTQDIRSDEEEDEEEQKDELRSRLTNDKSVSAQKLNCSSSCKQQFFAGSSSGVDSSDGAHFSISQRRGGQ